MPLDELKNRAKVRQKEQLGGLELGVVWRNVLGEWRCGEMFTGAEGRERGGLLPVVALLAKAELRKNQTLERP